MNQTTTLLTVGERMPEVGDKIRTSSIRDGKAKTYLVEDIREGGRIGLYEVGLWYSQYDLRNAVYEFRADGGPIEK